MLPAEEFFHRAYFNGEFDVAEIGFSPYLIAQSRGTAPYVALPVFLSRMFRHSAIYVRTDRGIERPGRPARQARRRAGVSDVRGDVVPRLAAGRLRRRPDEIHWRQGGLEQPGRKDKFPLNLPPDFPLVSRPTTSRSPMLADGTLDAVISARRLPVSATATPVRGCSGLRSGERDYFARPASSRSCMHWGSATTFTRAPLAAASLYKAFARPRRRRRDLFETTALKIGLPWVIQNSEATRALMGEDFWPYGVEANRVTLEAMARYSFEQGLAVRRHGRGNVRRTHDPKRRSDSRVSRSCRSALAQPADAHRHRAHRPPCRTSSSGARAMRGGHPGVRPGARGRVRARIISTASSST